MKNLLILILFLVLISGCSLQKKSVKTNNETSSKTEFNQSIESKSSGSIQNDKALDSSQSTQNDKKTDLKTTAKTTEYYPPVPGSGDEKGAIKSETTTTTEQQETDQGKQVNTNKETDTGKSEAKQDQKTNLTGSTDESTSNKSEETTKPAPDPKRFMWIFGILLICAGAFIYLKRLKVFPWIKSVLSRVVGFRKI